MPIATERRRRAYTVLELVLILAIIGLLASLVVTSVTGSIARAKMIRAIADIRSLERAIGSYFIDLDAYPDSLAQLDLWLPLDPWGRPYQYLRILGGSSPRGKWRKDRFLVPLNADYDLYSMGPDGLSRPPLTARHSRDDIVRAGNGAFVGPASEY